MAETPELFNTIAARYDRISNWLSADGIRAWRATALEQMHLQPGLRVLDVGCGTGTATLTMACKVLPTGMVTGLDPSRDMLAQAERAAAGELGAHTAWVLAGAEGMPFSDHEFDRVSAFFSLRNMQDWRAGLQEIRRVLKPGGRVVLLDMLQPTSTLGTLAMHGLKTVTSPLAGETLEPFRWLPRSLLHAPTSDELTAWMTQHGFVVQSTQHWLGDLVTLVVAFDADPIATWPPVASLGTTVVWATDGSEASQRAGRWMVRHLLKPSTTVHIVTVSPPFAPRTSDRLQDTDRSQWAKALADARQTLASSGCAAVASHLLFGPPAHTLVDYVKQLPADLLVMGDKHRSEGSERLTGRLTEQVVAQAGIPVLVIRHESETAPSSR
jgi:demethylmenaquinone methyltransferase/2-methoxy-6-polyprenyl-1,4-benzoquinol methylase